MMFFFFENSGETQEKVDLNPALCAVVLRLIQFRDKGYSMVINGAKEKVTSVSFNGKELEGCLNISSLNFNSCATERLGQLCFEAGYRPIRNCKTSVRVNAHNILIRSQEANKRPLINHTTRDKYLVVCRRLGMSIDPFDDMVRSYWKERKVGLIHEDVSNGSNLSPFKKHKEYLKPILTDLFFNGYHIQEGYGADLFLDYRKTEPWNDTVWHIYNKDNYIDSIWDQLVFSFRADRGMPRYYSPEQDQYRDIRPWAEPWLNRKHETVYKGALHIRVQPVSSAENRIPPVIANRTEEIKEFKGNIGEQDEYKIKIFLVQARDRHLSLPVGKEIQEIRSVGMPEQEYAPLPFSINLESLSEIELFAMAASCRIDKAPSSAKADVYVNHIGISIKSNRGAYPTLINQTRRSSILRVMKAINSPIAPLDAMIGRYWHLRMVAHTFGEDVSNGNVDSPFLGENGNDGLIQLSPLLNYFAFEGTGKKRSEYPATYILEFGDPFDKQTWNYYGKEDYITKVWHRLVFSLRGKGLPPKEKRNVEDWPWIRELDGKEKGTLNVRIGKK